MDLLIIDTIRYIKEKKKRTSVEAIYDKLKKDNDDLNDEEFIKEFKKLESKSIILNVKPSDDFGSYQVCQKTLINSYTEQAEIMKNEQLQDKKFINLLKDQLEFLKAELNQKNIVIDKLLLCINKKEMESESGGNKFIEEKSEEMKNSTVEPLTSNEPSIQEDKNNVKSDQQTQESENISESLNEQLNKIRDEKHSKYMREKYPSDMAENKQGKQTEKLDVNKEHQWKYNTVLIVGDSIINGLIEKRMGKNVKVRSFPGARIKDMYSYLIPLIEKKPKHIILHVSTNDANNKSSDELTNELLQLKQHIEKSLPESIIIISYPTIRVDKIEAKKTLIKLRENLSILNINAIENDNIKEEHLGKGGLHLNAKGSGRLAMNYISYMQHL